MDKKTAAEQLRKLAEQLREYEKAAAEKNVARAVRVLRAAKGLSILRDKVRGT